MTLSTFYLANKEKIYTTTWDLFSSHSKAKRDILNSSTKKKFLG